MHPSTPAPVNEPSSAPSQASKDVVLDNTKTAEEEVVLLQTTEKNAEEIRFNPSLALPFNQPPSALTEDAVSVVLALKAVTDAVSRASTRKCNPKLRQALVEAQEKMLEAFNIALSESIKTGRTENMIKKSQSTQQNENHIFDLNRYKLKITEEIAKANPDLDDLAKIKITGVLIVGDYKYYVHGNKGPNCIKHYYCAARSKNNCTATVELVGATKQYLFLKVNGYHSCPKVLAEHKKSCPYQIEKITENDILFNIDTHQFAQVESSENRRGDNIENPRRVIKVARSQSASVKKINFKNHFTGNDL